MVRSSRLVALTLTLTLLTVIIPGTALAGSVNATITSPGAGAHYTRLNTINYSATVTSTGCSGTMAYAWTFGDGGSASTAFATHTYSTLGPMTVKLVATQGSGTAGCKDTKTLSIVIDNILPTAALASIPEQTAGATVTLDAIGSGDADGTIASYNFTVDGVAQAPQAGSTLDVIFTTAGAHTVSVVVMDNNGGVSGAASRTFDVVAAALDSITVTGPATLVAGETGTYALAGSDAFGNAVALAQSSVDFSSTTAGPATVSYTESGVTGTLDITINPDVAVTMGDLAPDGSTVPAGGVYAFFVPTFDQFGNTAGTTAGQFVAPQTAGTAAFCHTVGEATGCDTILVVPAALSTITVSGPAFPVAGTTQDYSALGEDQFGNDIFTTTFSQAIPTASGPSLVCFTQDDISDCMDIDVLPDVTTSVLVSGADSMVAGVYTEFPFIAFDQYGNVVADNGLIAVVVTVAGPFDVCAEYAGVTGCKPIVILPDALATITIIGPETLVAGTTAEYALAGFDQYANSVALSQSSLSHTASTSVGTDIVSFSESGETGELAVAIVADQLFSILVDGPASMVAGTTDVFSAAGFDQYGNSVPLGAPTFPFEAPTAVGSANACTTEDDVTGCKLVDVVADALASIVISGVDSMVAGTTASFDLAGFDQYANSVPLAQSSVEHTAVTTVGADVVTYAQDGVTGERPISVTPDALASIIVTGPDSVIAGSTNEFALAGFDQYENAVALDAETLEFIAPNTASTVVVAYSEDGVTGEKSVLVTHAALASITLTGPTTVVAGTSADYALAGFDQYGNSVPLSAGSVHVDFPTLVGSQLVSYTEESVTGSLEVAIVADALASILVSGQDAMVAGTTASFDVAGFDQYGNSVPLAVESILFTAPQQVGTATVEYTEGTVTGSKLVDVLPTTLDVALVMETLASPLDAVDGVSGLVIVNFPGSLGIAGAELTLVFTHESPLGELRSETVTGETDESGIFAFEAPTLYNLPGSYTVTVSASALGSTGGDVGGYHVGP